MIKSLFSGVSGLKSHNQRMDVIGNNIANVNTTGFKAGNVTFKDVYYQTRQSATGGGYINGGVNPMQVGLGTRTGTIAKVMTQSGFTYSDNVFDCALSGAGFFQVQDATGNIFYTRLGRFGLDDFGNLTDANGNIVLGVSGDPTGQAANTQRITIRIPDIEDQAASFIKDFQGHDIIVRAGGIGPNGNIVLSLRDSKSPFANMGGNNLNVYMDLSVDYEQLAVESLAREVPPVFPPADPRVGNPPAVNAAGVTPAQRDAMIADYIMAEAQYNQAKLTRTSELFSAAMNDAIRLGGINLDPAVQPLSVEFVSVPDVTAAQRATSFIKLPSMTPAGAAAAVRAANTAIDNIATAVTRLTTSRANAANVPNPANALPPTIPNPAFPQFEPDGVTPNPLYVAGSPETIPNPAYSAISTIPNPDPQFGALNTAIGNVLTSAATAQTQAGLAVMQATTLANAIASNNQAAITSARAAATTAVNAANAAAAAANTAAVAARTAATDARAAIDEHSTPTQLLAVSRIEEAAIMAEAAAAEAAQAARLSADSVTIAGDTNKRIRFTVDEPGAFGNNYEINIETDGSPTSAPRAQWKGNVLTITLPDRVDVDVRQIELAILRAAAERPNFQISMQLEETDTMGNVTTIWTTEETTTFDLVNGTSTTVPRTAAQGLLTFSSGGIDVAQRLSPGGGTDSFFQEAFWAMRTLPLTGGTLWAEQDASTVAIFIDENGIIYGNHAVHGELLLGRIDVVEFVNPNGLQQVGTSYFVATAASGDPQVRVPLTEAETFIVSSALEMSNVDLSNEFSDMIITQRGFQANSRIITVSDSMLEELVNLKR